MKGKLSHFRYLLLLLAFVPFAVWVLSGRASEQREAELADLPLPDSSPFLAADSHMHWLFAVVSEELFLTAALCLLDGKRVGIWILAGGAAFTATVGVILLLAVQSLAASSSNEEWSGSASWMLLHYFLNGIAYSYRASSQADGNLLMQLIGYVFGVGLCEETTKLLPVLYRMRTRKEILATEVRVIGFMSGVGFGVAEGVLYSLRQYNGSAPAIIYFIRFFSVVAMHGISSAVAAGLLFAHNFHEDVEQELGLEPTWKLFAKFALIISPAIVLHALYDLFCDRGMFDGALLCELILLALLAYQIGRDPGVAPIQGVP